MNKKELLKFLDGKYVTIKASDKSIVHDAIKKIVEFSKTIDTTFERWDLISEYIHNKQRKDITLIFTALSGDYMRLYVEVTNETEVTRAVFYSDDYLSTKYEYATIDLIRDKKELPIKDLINIEYKIEYVLEKIKKSKGLVIIRDKYKNKDSQKNSLVIEADKASQILEILNTPISQIETKCNADSFVKFNLADTNL